MGSHLGVVAGVSFLLLGGCGSETLLAGEGREADVTIDAEARLDADGGMESDGAESAADDAGDACMPVAEICDGIDNDCDGAVDETFDFRSDLDHCGGCRVSCRDLPNAIASCAEGSCRIDACLRGWIDLNGYAPDGCEFEYECTPSATREHCDDGTCADAMDNDCDMRTDDTDPDCECGCVPEMCNYLDDDCDGLTDEDCPTGG